MEQPGTAPLGAKCAEHVDRFASLVCVRCGNFMCPECSEGGNQAQCPKCRALTGSSDFPFRGGDFDFNRIWNYAWEQFKREWLMLSVCVMIFLAVVFAGATVANLLSSMIMAVAGMATGSDDPSNLPRIFLNMGVSQVVGTLVNAVAQGVGLVGLYRVIIDVLHGRRADVGRMFSQLRKLPQFALLQLMLFVGVTIPTLVYFAVLGFVMLKTLGISLADVRPQDLAELLNPSVVGIAVVGTLLYLAVFFVVLLPVTMFAVPELVVSEVGAMEALRRAWRIGEGNRLATFGYTVVSALVMLVGALLCCVPVLPAIALGYALIMGLFLAARSGLDLPPPEHT